MSTKASISITVLVPSLVVSTACLLRAISTAYNEILRQFQRWHNLSPLFQAPDFCAYCVPSTRRQPHLPTLVYRVPVYPPSYAALRPSAASPSIEWRNARSRRLCSCLPRDANRELQVTLQAGGVACTLVGPCTMNPIADKSPLFRVHPRTSLRLLDCSCARSTG